MMKSNEIRKNFLDYFKKNNHEVLHSSSLVPHNDPTLMFANSGMVQFKNIFTGKEKRKYNRAATAQKCVRAGGKHNDLENVGYTTRHHTFFEMLGNFSFGDYFKDLAIELAWNLITKEYSINKDRLLVTVYSEDDEAFNLWKKIAGLSENKIIKINTSDNFWSMGETGPCGPCSEIFYDHGDKYEGGPPGSPNEDGDRFIEIWNLVFMQYEQISKTERINLPKPSIDTGMGLERMTALLDGSNDNYSTDLFWPTINESKNLCGDENSINNPSHRVIADHLKSSSFLISDGVMPSNEGRGYVLRRIMRRGMRHAHSLGNKDPIFHKLFPTFLKGIKDSYPELERAKDLILSTLLNEETKFKETVEKGIKILEDEISNSSNIFDGEVAFKLYDTYGFPLDLTQDYLKNKDIKVDLKTFNKKMLDQKQRARQNWKGTGDIQDDKIWYEITSDLNSTEFLGYKDSEAECKIIAIISQGKITKKIEKDKEAIIILNQTPFYGESGGQVGDSGYLENDNFKFSVLNTTKIFGNYFLHFGKIINGKCEINDTIKASINNKSRNLIKYNHSSTHLLHAALRKTLGNHVTQKGSLVNSEKLRFDFSHNNSIDKEELQIIEDIVNNQIKNNGTVDIKIIDQKKAIDEGAMALFGEKYGDEVRVVTMGNENGSYFSKELCGGTHVQKLGEINKFKIINQSSVASGIRRIEAVSNISVDQFIKEVEKNNIDKDIIQTKQLEELIFNIKKINPEYIFKNKYDNKTLYIKELSQTYQKLKQNKSISKNIDSTIIKKINNINFVYLIAKDFPNKSLKSFIDEQKKKYLNKSVSFIISNDQKKLSFVLGVSEDITNVFDASKEIKKISNILGGKGGGGRKDMAQGGGSDISQIDNCLKYIENKLSTIS
ncbi:MAG: Alanine--tRNA ligase [Alphaproteobacteria bacterium MarineAlpha5_Bin12]|nr:MAG: Alanine--tRNA ligase [Alphaproteobacteria bacterium MarineAlpha5_Bin12]